MTSLLRSSIFSDAFSPVCFQSSFNQESTIRQSLRIRVLVLLPHIPCCRKAQACPFDMVCEMNTHIIRIACDEVQSVMDNQCAPHSPWLFYLHSAYCFPLISYNMSRLLSDVMKIIIMATKISFFLQMFSKLTLAWSARSFLQCIQSCHVGRCILKTDLSQEQI